MDVISASDLKTVKNLNPVFKLSPCIDEEGFIRLKGRLKKSCLTYDQKHPILLNFKHPVIRLLVEHEHKLQNHEGIEHARNILQQKYWILGLRSGLRSVRNNCFKCREFAAINLTPEMADLPLE